MRHVVEPTLWDMLLNRLYETCCCHCKCFHVHSYNHANSCNIHIHAPVQRVKFCCILHLTIHWLVSVAFFDILTLWNIFVTFFRALNVACLNLCMFCKLLWIRNMESVRRATVSKQYLNTEVDCNLLLSKVDNSC